MVGNVEAAVAASVGDVVVSGEKVETRSGGEEGMGSEPEPEKKSGREVAEEEGELGEKGEVGEEGDIEADGPREGAAVSIESGSTGSWEEGGEEDEA